MSDTLTALSPLLQPASWQGQEYFTSQYFHQQYLANSQYGGKYQRHADFLRVVRRIPAYDKFQAQGDIVELAWGRIKAEVKQVLRYFQPLFHLTGYRPLTLLNATAQAELHHHLDDELSQQLAVASSTMVARQMTRKPSNLLPMEQATRELEAGLHAAKLLGTPLHIAQQEIVKLVDSRHGIDFRPLLLSAPAQDNIVAEKKMLEPTDLAKTLGLSSGYALNRALEQIGWQVKRIGGGWEPTPTGIPYATQHAWVRGTKSGYNLKWNEQAVVETLHAHNLLAEES